MATAYAPALAAILESLGYGVWGGGTTTGASLFVYREPPVDGGAPAVATTIYAPGGPMDTLDYSGDTHGARPAQIRFRDTDPVGLETRAEGLYALWAAWKFYSAYFLRVKASTKPLYTYAAQESNAGLLFIASFNLTVIQGS